VFLRTLTRLRESNVPESALSHGHPGRAHISSTMMVSVSPAASVPSFRASNSSEFDLGDAMNRRGIILFYPLTYAFAWGLSALFLFLPVWMVAHFGPVTLWNPIIFATIWTPTIWAFVLAFALDGAAGLRDLVVRVFRWRIKWRWYLVSTLG